MKKLTFADRVVIQAFAGDGGDGCASFRREKYIPKGGPDGGDGGDGGSVLLRAIKDVNCLLDLYYQPLQRAEHGERGRGKDQYGRCGANLALKVPCGTEIRDAETGREIGEVINDGEEVLVAKGGKGGLGNIHFKTSTHQAPREFTKGTKGEQRKLLLILKTVAEVGLVGYPNAGKSTLLGQISAAHPKVAAYPFTTLHPTVGTMIFDGNHTIRVADIPGLIDGAHQGVGLGHDFLRHIERTKLLLFVIDMAGTDHRNPTEDYLNLRQELKLYREDLNQRPYMIVANKMDEPAALKNLQQFRRRTREKPLKMSAVLGEGVPALAKRLGEHFFPNVQFHP